MLLKNILKPFQGLSWSSNSWVQGISSQIYNGPALAICSQDLKSITKKVHNDISSNETDYTRGPQSPGHIPVVSVAC